jgi:hypothetical protein
MTHPPSRADQVRMMGGARGANVQASARMTAIDMDDPNIRADGWFAYVMPVQSGVEMMGAGRYGYWTNQPDVKIQDDCIVISGNDDKDGTEPIFVAPRASVVSVHVATAAHIQATPFPIAQPQPTTPDTAA